MQAERSLSGVEDPAGRVHSPQAVPAHPGSSPLTGFPVPKPELISQLEQEEELWVLDLLGAEEPDVLRSCQTGEHKSEAGLRNGLPSLPLVAEVREGRYGDCVQCSPL